MSVSKFIDIHSSRENLPADSLPRICARQEVLRVRFRNLMKGDFGLNEMEFIPPREGMVRVKALPAKPTLWAASQTLVTKERKKKWKR